MSVLETYFSTRELESEKREEAWRETIGAVFDIECKDKDILQSPSVLHSFHLGDVMLTHCTTHGQAFVRNAKRLSVDPVDHYLVQLYLEGHSHLKHTQDGRVVQQGDIVIHDMANQHHSINTDTFSNLTCIVPRRLLAPFLDRPDTQAGNILDRNAGLTQVLANQMVTLFKHNQDIPAEALGGVTSSLITLVSTAINTGSLETTQARAGEKQQLSTIVMIKDLIHQNLGNPDLNIDEVAQHCGLSRSKLYRLFAPYGGVRAYVQDQRMKKAVKVLRDPNAMDTKIYQIAMACGFKSEAHFSRVFKETFGVSPRDTRHAPNLPFGVSTQTSAAENPGGQFSQWFKTIG